MSSRTLDIIYQPDGVSRFYQPGGIYGYILLGNTGPISRFDMQESSGASFIDMAGLSHNAVITGGVTLGSVGPGLYYINAATFDGINGMATSVCDIDSYPLSFSCWIRQDIPSAGSIASLCLSTAANKYFAVGVDNSGKVTVTRSNTTPIVTTSPGINIADGRWHHIAVIIHSSTNISIYVDMELEVDNETVAAVTLNAATCDQFLIGATEDFVGSGFIAADLCAIEIYNTELTSIDIEQLYFFGAGVYITPKEEYIANNNSKIAYAYGNNTYSSSSIDRDLDQEASVLNRYINRFIPPTGYGYDL